MTDSQKKTSDGFDWEWSPKHTRLRYQLLISAIVFSSFLRFDFINSFEAPFLGIRFEGSPSKIEFLIFFLFFYVYTLVSFFVRTVNERHELDNSSKLILAATEKVIAKLNQNMEFFKQLKTPNNLHVSTRIQQLSGKLSDVEGKVSTFKNRLEHLHARLSEQFKFLHQFRDLAFKFSNDLLALTSNKPNATNKITIDQKLFDHTFFSNGVDMFYSEDFFKDIDVVAQEILDISKDNTFDSLNADVLEKTKNAFKELDKEYIQQLAAVKKAYDEMLAEGPSDLRAFENSVEILNKEAKKRTDYSNFERELLGFWGPVLASLFIIGFGFGNVLAVK